MTVRTSVELYVVFDGVQRPIVPRVQRLLGKSLLNVRDGGRYVPLDDSREINTIARQLKHAREDDYVSLAARQDFVRAGNVSTDEMRETLRKFYEQVCKRRDFIAAEIMDSQPQYRGRTLPPGMNAFLYRGDWKPKEGNDIDVSGLTLERDIVPVLVPRQEASLNKPWRDVTGAGERVKHYPPDLEYSKQHSKGLNFLRWGFAEGDNTRLDSAGVPSYKVSLDGANEYGSGVGVILGSAMHIDELLEAV